MRQQNKLKQFTDAEPRLQRQRWAEWPKEERIKDLQELLGHEPTGTYMNQDYQKLKQLPRLVREVLELYYGLEGREHRTMSRIAKDMDTTPHIIRQTILDCSEYLQELAWVEGRYDRLNEDLCKRERELRSDTALTELERRRLRDARRAVDMVLKADEEKRAAVKDED